MILEKIIHYRGSLRSGLARRVFRVFFLCTLIPLCALAYFAFSHVSTELQRQAERRLHESCKSTGNTLYERLVFLETDLLIIRKNIGVYPFGKLEDAVRQIGTRIEERFETILVAEFQGDPIRTWGEPCHLYKLQEDQIAHLQQDRTLVLEHSDLEGLARALVARAIEPSNLSKGILFACIKPDYLWGGDGFLSPTTELMAYHKESRNLLFYSGSDSAPCLSIDNALSQFPALGQFEYESAEEAYVVRYWTLFMKHHFGTAWVIAQCQLRDDIMAPLDDFKRTFMLVTGLSFLLVILFSIHHIKKNLVPIEVLQAATGKIAEKDFSGRVCIESGDEFEDLGSAFNKMSESMEAYDHVMKNMVRIGVALTGEKRLDQFFEILLRGVRNIVYSDGANLYLLNQEGNLVLVLRQVNYFDTTQEKLTDLSIAAPSRPERECRKTVANLAMTRKETLCLKDLYKSEEGDFSETMEIDRLFGYRTKSVLSVPMMDHEGEIIGVLELINARDRVTGELIDFTEGDRELMESLTSQAAVALTKNRLLDDFKNLFESFIELLASTIDEKSPNTGGHCRRVPVLARMLAEAACRTSEGPLRDFTMSEDEFYELNVAALLHDCGKIVTPNHIIDKATKLEGVYDRMRLVEARFELVEHQAVVAALLDGMSSSEFPGNANGDQSEESFKAFKDRIREDIDFLKRCNKGKEPLSAEMQERIREIAARYRWRDLNGTERPILFEDEINNLTIPRGTLNEREREIIRCHVVTTIKMLESLPYPRNLKDVPILAGSHHERIDGKGYPNGLTGDEMQVRSKILCIADIFEALTSADRKYRAPMTLSKAVHILKEMAEEGHIDPDLFQVFLREKVHLDYAMEYMDPRQVDTVELSEVEVCPVTSLKE